jgi:hypothetical protein
MRLSVLACILLSGCASAPVVGAAAGGGIIASIVVIRQDADLGLTVIKPINSSIICPVAERDMSKSAKLHAGIVAFCANLPTTVEGIVVQAAAIMLAVNGAK